MRVRMAKTAGFCMGVDLALKKLDDLITGNPPERIFTLGPIIHNPQVLARYAEKGVRRLGSGELEQIAPGDHVVIRAHGVPRQTIEDLTERGARITNATCPKVMKAQVLIAREAGRGGRLLLFGEHDHPEVKGLLSHARPGALLFETMDDVPDVRPEDLGEGEFFVLAAQTTQDRAAFQAVAHLLAQRLGGKLKTLDTICDATKARQEEAVEVARQVDLMIVAGGRDSGNTRRLVTVCEAVGAPCLHVETAEELAPELLKDLLKNARSVGLTAGASTPAWIIEDVRRRLIEFTPAGESTE